jgi:hypothetical protein
MPTTSTIEAPAPSHAAPLARGEAPPFLSGDPRRHASALLCVAGVLLLAFRTLALSALGVELLAAAFWGWARAATDAAQQVPRWNWLRRPASALWLAAALEAASATGAHHAHQWQLAIGACALAAALELMGALPFARPFPDLTGPLVAGRPWLPVLLPTAGFLVLWGHAPLWQADPLLADTAFALLLVATLLAALRAFGHARWTACLRWLVVADGSLAGLVMAAGAAPALPVLVAWWCASGGHAVLLAGELRGSMPRRGLVMTGLWRTATWCAMAVLAWPLLARLALLRAPAAFSAAALPVLLLAWTTVARVTEAPERRTVQRPSAAALLLFAAPLVLLPGGLVALSAMWRAVVSPGLGWALAAVAPAALGGLLALAGRRAIARAQAAVGERVAWFGLLARRAARALFLAVVSLERRLLAAVRAVLLAVVHPLRELHSGDAQEYLLMVAALALLALVLPLLRG